MRKDTSALDRLRAHFTRPDRAQQQYEPLENGSLNGGDDVRETILILPGEDGEGEDEAQDEEEGEGEGEGEGEEFSWLEYYIFLLLGVAMLWAW